LSSTGAKFRMIQVFIHSA